MLARKTELRRAVGLTRKKGFKKPDLSERKRPSPGKKVLAWEKTRRALKVRFERAGITRCEYKGPGCTGGLYLGFAHSKKRNAIQGDELSEVILCCSTCHDSFEFKPNMTEIVRNVIANRCCVV